MEGHYRCVRRGAGVVAATMSFFKTINNEMESVRREDWWLHRKTESGMTGRDKGMKGWVDKGGYVLEPLSKQRWQCL